jgi:hypothetical protein
MILSEAHILRRQSSLSSAAISTCHTWEITPIRSRSASSQVGNLPVVLASRPRALGLIGPDTKAATILFDNGESGVEFVVAIVQQKFSNGGSWSKFVCPCGRRCQKLRLFEGRPTCAHCIRSAGLRYRVEMFSHASKRVALTAPKRTERLSGDTPARLHPRPGRMLDRRANLELRLKRSLIVERRAAIEQFEKDAGKP